MIRSGKRYKAPGAAESPDQGVKECAGAALEVRTVARASAVAPWGIARMCWTTACCRPRASPAGLSGRSPIATARLHHGTGYGRGTIWGTV